MGDRFKQGITLYRDGHLCLVKKNGDKLCFNAPKSFKLEFPDHIGNYCFKNHNRISLHECCNIEEPHLHCHRTNQCEVDKSLAEDVWRKTNKCEIVRLCPEFPGGCLDFPSKQSRSMKCTSRACGNPDTIHRQIFHDDHYDTMVFIPKFNGIEFHHRHSRKTFKHEEEGYGTFEAGVDTHCDYHGRLKYQETNSIMMTHTEVGPLFAGCHFDVISVSKYEDVDTMSRKAARDQYLQKIGFHDNGNDGFSALEKCVNCSVLPHKMIHTSTTARKLIHNNHLNRIEHRLLRHADTYFKIRDREKKIMITTIIVDGICDTSEEVLIRQLLETLPGIEKIEIQIMEKIIKVHHLPEDTPSAMIIAVLNTVKFGARLQHSEIFTRYNHLASIQLILCFIFFSCSSLMWIGEFFPISPKFWRYENGQLVSVVVWSQCKYFSVAIVFIGGPNLLYKATRSVMSQILNINIIITIMVILAFFCNQFFAGGALVFFNVLSEEMETRSIKNLQIKLYELINLLPSYGTTISGDPIAIENIRVNDHMSLRQGFIVPSDGVLLRGEIVIEEHQISHDKDEVHKKIGDLVYAGSYVISGYAEIKTRTIAHHSIAGRISSIIEKAILKKTNFEEINHIACRFYVPVLLLIGILIFTLPIFIYPEVIFVKNANMTDFVAKITYHMIVILILSSPDLLNVSTSATIINGIITAANHYVLVKNAHNLEAMGDIGTLLYDKTGTITEGKFAVQAFDMVNPQGPVGEKDMLRLLGAVESQSQHPVAQCVIDYCRKKLPDQKLNEIPVKKNQIIEKEGIEGKVAKQKILAGNQTMAERLGWPLDTHSLPGNRMWIGIENIFVARMVLEDRIREECFDSLLKVKKLGVKPLIVSGDHSQQVENVAKSLDVDFRGGMSAQEKYALIRENQVNDVIGYVSDGIGDTGALERSDVSLSLGFTKNIIKGKSDIIIMDSNLDRIPFLIQLGRKLYYTIQWNRFIFFISRILILALVSGGLFFDKVHHPLLYDIIFSPWVAYVIGIITMQILLRNANSIYKKDVPDDTLWEPDVPDEEGITENNSDTEDAKNNDNNV